MLAVLDAAAQAQATRPILWNIPLAMVVWMYASAALALGVCVWGFMRRAQLWRAGVPEPRTDHWPRRLGRVALDALAQRAVVRSPGAGVPHALLFLGFLVLLAATTVVLLQMDLGLPVMHGGVYLWLLSLATNVFGGLALLGIIVLALRRYACPAAIVERREPEDALLLGGLFLLLGTGFVVSGLRMVATADPWSAWRPLGWATGRALAALLPPAWLPGLHRWTWLLHVTLWGALLALLPWTRLRLLLTTPLAQFFGTLDRRQELPCIDFEALAAGAGPDVLGVRTVLELSRKQLLELDACTGCGRCERTCPARVAGFPLSPRRLIADIRDHVRQKRDVILAAGAARRRGDAAELERLRGGLPSLDGEVVADQAFWACTTCRSCESVCPAGIEHVRLILQLRQNAAMEKGELPDGLAALPRQLELREHPFCGVPVDRHAWFAELTPSGAGYLVGSAAGRDA
ncbi:MAG TPA: (Fe-S)-binding protein [Longimicrobiales bacterium]